MQKTPNARIKVEEALVHPWIVERVKIASQKGKCKLYSQLNQKDQRKFEDLIEKMEQKFKQIEQKRNKENIELGNPHT